MQKILFIVALICGSFHDATAQSKKELSNMLSRDLQTYQRATLSMNYDTIFYFMPSGMFDLIPQDSLRAVMSNAMDNEYFTIKMTGFVVKGKPKIKKAQNYSWAFVPHEGRMTFQFKEADAMSKMMVTMMKSQFGSENVKELSADAMEITLKDKQMIAYKEPGLDHWTFLEDKRKEKGKDSALQREIYQTVVPEAVRKAVGD
jgi:hypothetical protein